MNIKKTKKSMNLMPYIVLTIVVIGSYIFLNSFSTKINKMDYNELTKEIENNNVKELVVTPKNAAGVYILSGKLNNYGKGETFTVTIPYTDTVVSSIYELAESHNLKVQTNTNPENSTWLTIVVNVVPIIIFGVLAYVMIAKLSNNGKGTFDFSKSRAKLSEDGGTKTFKDVAGLKEEKEEVQELIDFLKNPKKFTKMGARIPKGVLLVGPPGTGKTLLAKAVAGEAKVPFFYISGSDFVELFVGVGASRVRDMFKQAKQTAPCLIFIDEIDAVGARRTGGSGAESENNQTLNQLLVEMDGFETNETVIVLAATNRPEMLDKALLRPGRFDRQITIAVPDARGREEILKIHSENKPLGEDINLKDIAANTAGFTGAELANVLNEAAIIATTRKHEKIVMDDLEEAVKKVTVGLQKNSRVISEKDKKLTAYHEAGHAVVSKYLETQQDVKEISIIPRGLAGGYTMYKTNEDKYYISRTEMEEKLVALLGGRAAEKIALNDISTGASNDIEVATQIAKDMVKKYGMSDRVGPINLEAKEQYELQVFGNNIEDVIGVEVKTLIDTAYKRAQELILANMDKLHAVAQKLLEKETITAEEFNIIFNEK